MKYRTRKEAAALKERVVVLSCLLMTNKQIAERVGCHDAYVSAILKARGFTPFLRRGETSGIAARGIYAGQYSGGRFVSPCGYEMIYCPGHPRADRNGHVMGHILIAEMKEKRHIKRGEIVHHINGNRLDNREENLHVFPSISEHVKHHARQRRTFTPIIEGGM